MYFIIQWICKYITLECFNSFPKSTSLTCDYKANQKDWNKLFAFPQWALLPAKKMRATGLIYENKLLHVLLFFAKVQADFHKIKPGVKIASKKMTFNQKYLPLLYQVRN